MIRPQLTVFTALAFGVAALMCGWFVFRAVEAKPVIRITGYTPTIDPVTGLSGGRNLYSVALNASGDVGFATGEDGLVLRWNGREWKPDDDAIAVADGAHLAAIDVDSSGKRALAVGGSGFVMSWDGKGWKLEPQARKLAEGRQFFALDLDEKGKTAWAVGQYGVALHWNGSNWKRVPTPFQPPGYVSGGAPVDSFGMWSVWIEPNGIGAVATGNGNRILRWSGRAWDDDKSAPDIGFDGDAFAGMESIAGSKDGKFRWITGNGTHTLIWMGSRWHKVELASRGPEDDFTVSSVACDGTGSITFAVGMGGTIAKWDGTNWSADDSGRAAAGGLHLDAVALNERGDLGFAVGQGGLILRWDGKSWQRDPVGDRPSYGQFSSLAMSDDGKSGWAVGFNETPLVWDGHAWKADRSARPDSMRLNVMWMTPDGNRVVGGGTNGIYEWNGSGWVERFSGNGIFDLVLTGDERLGFAGDDRRKILRYDGSGWKEDEQAMQEADGMPVTTIHLSPDGKVGFAGGSNLFLRWDGSTWHKDAGLSTWTIYYDICLSNDQTIGFAVGSGPNGESILRWDGAGWKSDPEAARVFSNSGRWDIAISDDGETGIAACWDGTVLHWDGKMWRRHEAASSLARGHFPVSVWLDSSGKTGWLLGRRGFLMRLDGTVAQADR